MRILDQARLGFREGKSDGAEGKHRGQGGDPLESAIGFANYALMVAPQRGAELRARAFALRAKFRG